MDSISALNIWCQKQRRSVHYQSSKIGGLEHNPQWQVRVTITGEGNSVQSFVAEALSVAEAKQKASHAACTALGLTTTEIRNCVGELNSYCQTHHCQTPVYEPKMLADGIWQSSVTIMVEDRVYQAVGRGSTIKAANQSAAREVQKVLPVQTALSPTSTLPASMPAPAPVQAPVPVKAAPPLLAPSNFTVEQCGCSAQVNPKVALFIDADNVPREACLHYNCAVYNFVGKLTAFPPKRSRLCSNSRNIRCQWHSSDAVDVLLAMHVARLGAQGIVCVVVSRDQIMQSVVNAAQQMGIYAQWVTEVPPQYLTN